MFAYFSIGPMELLVVILMTLTTLVLPAWLAWKVSVKAGFSGALGILVIIPAGILIFLFVLAFKPWPNLQRSGDH